MNNDQTVDISLENRKKKILEKYPDKIPVIVQTKQNSKLILEGKNKFLIPKTHSIGLFTLKLRERMNLDAEKAIFVFINNTSLSMGSIIEHIYTKYKDDDGFLTISISEENAYG